MDIRKKAEKLYAELVARETCEWNEYLVLLGEFRSIAAAVGSSYVWGGELHEEVKNTIRLCDVLLTEYLHELREEAQG